MATLDLPRECVTPPPRFPFFSSDFVCWWLENGWEDQEPSLSFFLFLEAKAFAGFEREEKDLLVGDRSFSIFSLDKSNVYMDFFRSCVA